MCSPPGANFGAWGRGVAVEEIGYEGMGPTRPSADGPDVPAAGGVLAAVLNAMDQPVWICSAEGVMLEANDAARVFARRLGFGAEPEGRPLREILGLGEAAWQRDLGMLRATAVGEVLCTGPSGSVRLAFHVSLVQGQGGAILQAVVVGRAGPAGRGGCDPEGPRLDSLGELAAIAAHEIRNPLSAVRGFLQLLSAQVCTEPQAHYVDIVSRELQRIERITGDLLLLSRPGRQAPVLTDMAGLLLGVAELVRPRAGHCGVSVDVVAEGDLPQVAADPERLKQVFLNLVGNAIEAAQAGGSVRLQVRRHPDGGVEALVSDDGPGLAPHVLSRVFEPFFTTKAGGTGLGLAVSDSIVRGFGGQIAAFSPPEGGATFVVRLPTAGAADPPAPPGGGPGAG